MSDNTTQPLLGEFKAASYEEWREAAEQLLKGAPFEKKMLTKTPEGITLQPIYNPSDIEGLPHLDSLPGQRDFARGVSPEGYTAQAWDIAQELPYGTPEAFNRALLADLMRGQSAVNVPLDIACQLGKDPDHAQAGEVGACGLSLASVADCDVAFKDVIPEAAPFYFQAGASTLPLAALLFAWCEKHHRKPETLRGGLNADPLAVLASSGSLPSSLEAAYDEMAALTSYTSEYSPNMAAIGVSALPCATAGASAVEELGYALAVGAQYLRALAQRGLSIDQACGQMLFTFAIGPMFFMEVAKFRAARILWSKVVAAFGGSDQACAMRIHGRTTFWNKTVHDPYVNMLRTSTEALSAAIGGVQSMHVGPFDEIIREPDTFSRRIARNTQIMLQEECELTAVADPAGGSWFIEKLTQELAEKAWGFFQEIEQAGGIVSALESGMLQERIGKVRADRLKRIGTRQQGLIGTNLFPNLEEKPLERKLPDYAALREQRASEYTRLRTSNSDANDAIIMNQLKKIVDKPQEGRMAMLIEAASAGATLGELATSLRANETVLPTIEALPSARGAQPYEKLRQAAANYRETKGQAPRIYLTNIGPLKRHKARMDFTTGFFQTGGFEIVPGQGASDPQEAAKMCSEASAPITVVCGTDDDYVEFLPAFCKALKTMKPDIKIILAGFPGEHEEAYKAAGLDDYIFVKTPNYAYNQQYLEHLGAL